jgi:riboflavin kinase / FMN adenylyltransferase
MMGKITGQVIKGSGYGKSQAFATINLDPKLWPSNKARGIYAAWVYVGEQRYKGALFFGPRVVIDEETDVLEIHLLDYSGDLYGQKVSLSIEDYIREVRPFANFADLKSQIAADITVVRACLSD